MSKTSTRQQSYVDKAMKFRHVLPICRRHRQVSFLAVDRTRQAASKDVPSLTPVLPFNRVNQPDFWLSPLWAGRRLTSSKGERIRHSDSLPKHLTRPSSVLIEIQILDLGKWTAHTKTVEIHVKGCTVRATDCAGVYRYRRHVRRTCRRFAVTSTCFHLLSDIGYICYSIIVYALI